MNLLESSAYYIWWLKNHHIFIPQRQIEEEVYQLIVKFNLHVEYDSMEDSYFDYLDTPEYLYLQELRRFGYSVDTYEEYLQYFNNQRNTWNHSDEDHPMNYWHEISLL